MAKKGYKRRRRRKSVLYGPISFIVICIVLIIGVSVFFKVTDVEIVGAERYSSDEVVEASAIEIGDNLLSLGKSKAVSSIFTKLPYVEKVTISKGFPNKVVITITESAEAGYISDGTSCWVISPSCKILAQIDPSEVGDIPEITGFTLTSPTVGYELEAAEGESSKLDYLKNILTALNDRDMISRVENMDITSVANLTFRLDGKYNVRFGSNDKVTYKLELFLSALEQIGDNETGTFDLTKESEVHFIPD